MLENLFEWISNQIADNSYYKRMIKRKQEVQMDYHKIVYNKELFEKLDQNKKAFKANLDNIYNNQFGGIVRFVENCTKYQTIILYNKFSITHTDRKYLVLALSGLVTGIDMVINTRKFYKVKFLYRFILFSLIFRRENLNPHMYLCYSIKGNEIKI